MSDTQHESAPEARRYGFPAVYHHEVCAVRTSEREGGREEGRENGESDSPAPARIQLLRWREGSGALVKDLPLDRLYVWARAGRVSFGDRAGTTVDVVLLGEPETEDLKLGTPWPIAHSRTSVASNIARGVVDDLRNAVTFPASFPRMMRISGERNAVLDALVAWCQREVPGVHILRGWPRGSEHPSPHQVSGLPHKGLLGEHGWLPDTVGARPSGWSPFGNDRNAHSATARRKAHEHPSGA
ncbi:MAG: hypothetical protein ACJ786_30995 [Catenulispora sp.]